MASKAQQLMYPSDLVKPDRFPAWINFSFYNRQNVSKRFPTDKVDLYMPESVQNPSTVRWDTENFGFVGNEIATRAKNISKNGWDGLSEVSSWQYNENTRGQAGALIKARGLANIGSAAASFMGGSVTAEGLMGEVAGKIPNPFLTMVFKGLDFRTFSFVFKFYPFSEDECQLIYDIIKIFRKNALPYKDAGGAFLGYPMECDITYKWKGGPSTTNRDGSNNPNNNAWLHRFKPAHCVAIDVDYTSSGMFSIMRNGFPSEITMSTKWSERELVTREDVELPMGKSY